MMINPPNVLLPFDTMTNFCSVGLSHNGPDGHLQDITEVEPQDTARTDHRG